MASKGHKRKHSIQDTPVDLSKMKMAMNHLVSLKEELDGIQETEGEMDAVMEHVHALEKILENAKKPVCKAISPTDTSSSPRHSDSTFRPRPKTILKTWASLEKILTSFLRALTSCCPSRMRLTSLTNSIHFSCGLTKSMIMLTWMCVSNTLIFGVFTNIRAKCEPGSRMILDAVLLSIAKISAKRDASRAVAILPKMRLGTGDGIMISHPISKYEVWLTGNVDYGVVQYQASTANKGLFIFITSFSINFLCSVAVGRGRHSRSRFKFGGWTALSC